MDIDPRHPGIRRTLDKAVLMSRLAERNLLSRAPVTGDAPVVVALTSYGRRLSVVGFALESIAAGGTRPARLIFYVTRDELGKAQTAMVRRLMRRGLEVVPVDDFGPHKKNYPYARDHADQGPPLVTADDDLLYPPGWLTGLVAAHRAHPDEFVGYRAHLAAGTESGFEPYSTWGSAPVDVPGHRVFITGGAGAAFPLPLLRRMRDSGVAFSRSTPRADDVWINLMALRAGIRSRRIGAGLMSLTGIPRSQGADALHMTNVHGGNDEQLRSSFTDQDLTALFGGA